MFRQKSSGERAAPKPIDMANNRENERVVCRCLGITEKQVVQALRDQSVRDINDIACRTGAGDGCTACHKDLKRLIDEHRYLSGVPIFSVK